jgi:hypothetical protein
MWLTKIVLAKKFKALRADLKKWNDLDFWNLDQRKKAILDELQILDVAEEQNPLFGEENLD